MADGRFGLLARSGTTSVDRWRIGTNDEQFQTAQPPPPSPPPPPVTPTVTVTTTDDTAHALVLGLRDTRAAA